VVKALVKFSPPHYFLHMSKLFARRNSGSGVQESPVKATGDYYSNVGGEVVPEVRRFSKKKKTSGEKKGKKEKTIKPIVSSEVLEVCENDKYVKCSLCASLSDGNILINIWSTLVDQMEDFWTICV